MDFVKMLWPTPFNIKEKDLTSFVVQLIVFAIVIIVASVLMWVLAFLPIIKVVVWLLGGLLDVYAVVGVILCILKFLGIVK